MCSAMGTTLCNHICAAVGMPRAVLSTLRRKAMNDRNLIGTTLISQSLSKVRTF